MEEKPLFKFIHIKFSISEEKMFSDCGFSISVGNIIESSTNNSSSSSSQFSPNGSETNAHSIFNNVKIKNPGVFNKKRRRGRQTCGDETQMVKTRNLTDDGYGWRKYGQKKILKELHPKSYYRCTHHKEEKCEAKKWIQQESETPPIYKTTYLGHHTCKKPIKIPQIFFDPSSPITPSAPGFICFDSPTVSHVFNINGDHQQTMKTCETGSNSSSSPPSSWSDESMMLMDDQAGFDFGTNPSSITSPNCSFGSYDFDLMIQELLAHDSVDFMQDYTDDIEKKVL